MSEQARAGADPGPDDTATVRPGEVVLAAVEHVLGVERDRILLVVGNGSRRAVRVSSHYPFERVNRRLEFDREAAGGFRLDIPAGATVGWVPGETREVGLVRYGGTIGAAARSGRGAGARFDARSLDYQRSPTV